MAGFKGASSATPRTGGNTKGNSEGTHPAAGHVYGTHSGGQGGTRKGC